MRKVEYNYTILEEVGTIGEKSFQNKINRTEFTGKGYFHQWMVEEEIIKAIVEKDDGEMLVLCPSEIKFLNNPPNDNTNNVFEIIKAEDVKDGDFIILKMNDVNDRNELECMKAGAKIIQKHFTERNKFIGIGIVQAFKKDRIK